MTTWLETAKALIVGTVAHPKGTTVVVKDKRTGRVQARQVPATTPKERSPRRTQSA